MNNIINYNVGMNDLSEGLQMIMQNIYALNNDFRNLAQRIDITVLGVIKTLPQVILFNAFPVLSMCCITIGFVCNDKVKRIVQDVVMVFKSFQTIPGILFLTGMGIVTSAVYWPYVILGTTTFCALRFGAVIYHSSLVAYRNHNPGLVYP